jgi:hypothetical protein
LDIRFSVYKNPPLILNGAYKYVNRVNDFYVNDISWIIGSTGDPLTLTGNLFEHIHEVRVGNVLCTTTMDATGADGTDTCTFTLPTGLTGEVDITITMDNPEATTYRFAKIFEYKN